jgi:regulator of protease activity HflC (stomatin/prohibitin superfamily)
MILVIIMELTAILFLLAVAVVWIMLPFILIKKLNAIIEILDHIDRHLDAR